MSVVEDFRKVLQDFLAPKLRAVAVRLDGLDKRMDSFERRMETNHQAVLAAIAESARHVEKRFESVVDYTRVLERVAKIEERQSTSQQ